VGCEILLRRAITPMVSLALVGGLVGGLIGGLGASAAPSETRSPLRAAAPPRTPRVLFVGDSVMDQQGSHAALLLRQSGVSANVSAHWGSTLFTPGQYRSGRSVPQRARSDRTVHWLSLAPRLVQRYQPTLVVVELDHNYWLPLPTDARGRPISDLGSSAAQQMIDAQLRSFVGTFRAAGAQVVWVAPTPSKTRAAELWPKMATTLARLRVEVIDPNASLRRAPNLRRAAALDCAGAPQPLWMADAIHLTRFGAGMSATALAQWIARETRVRLIDAAAPGERTVAIVPSANGYHLVQCDGSVYHFGDAPIVGSARSLVTGGPPVVDAVASPDGGLWLVRADRSVLAVGGAPPGVGASFDPTELTMPRRVADPSGGSRLIDTRGNVEEFDGAADLGDAVEVLPADPFASAWARAHPRPPVADVAAVAAGGLYVVTENGEVIALGAVHPHGDTADLAHFTD
jgi:lysophospholipase L1-like esterase